MSDDIFPIFKVQQKEKGKLKGEIKQETKVDDGPVKKTPKLTKPKAGIVKSEIKEDELADPNPGLSDYEKKVQANIAERMKFLESLDIFKDM